MQSEYVTSGYLEVKISAKVRRGFTPWKAWQKQYCEIKRLDGIEFGLELKLKSSSDGTVLNKLTIPRNATLHRTESRTQQFAFGVFSSNPQRKPLIYLSGKNETDSQQWICSIRRMLCIASYLNVGESKFHVSIVDNVHSRKAGLTGLFGVLGTNAQEVVISDPCTGDQKISFKWHQFHQFHLQATGSPDDEKKICVLHTSKEFSAGPGQLYLFCLQAPRMLHYLMAKGKQKSKPGLISQRRFSRSDSDLRDSGLSSSPPLMDEESPEHSIKFRSHSGSEDSGVRVSLTSDDSGSGVVLKSKMAASLISIGLGLLSQTPGGSEIDDDSDSSQDMISFEETPDKRLNKQSSRDSHISEASGIYEEISEVPVVNSSNCKSSDNSSKKSTSSCHVYENPQELLFGTTRCTGKPPPLPPRRLDGLKNDCDNADKSDSDFLKVPSSSSNQSYLLRCRTLPAKDMKRISQTFTGEGDYLPMSPAPLNKNHCEETYTVMQSPMSNQRTPKCDNFYMVMTGSSSRKSTK